MGKYKEIWLLSIFPDCFRKLKNNPESVKNSPFFKIIFFNYVERFWCMHKKQRNLVHAQKTK